MVLDFLYASCAEPAFRVAEQQFIDEIQAERRPFEGKLIDSHSCLSCKYLFLDLSAICACIRSATQHKLMRNDSKCKEISNKRMRPSHHHFRRHVSWSSTCILLIIFPRQPRNPQVSQPQIPICIKH